MIRSLLSALLATAVVAAAPASALDWSDNALRYQYGPNYSEPGVSTSGTPVGPAKSVHKNIVGFTHVDGYKFGGNFLSVNMLLSNAADPTNRNTTQGATEVYAIYRHDLSLNKVTSSKNFEFGPIRDVLLEAGADLSTKNTAFAPHKAMLVAGPVVSLKVPGFLNVGVLVNKEWNNNGAAHVENGRVDFTRGGSVEFDPAVMFASSWGVPVYGAFSFEGFASVNLPKGRDGFNRETVAELLVHPRVMWDAGSLFGSKGYQLGVGYEYWLNKFGNNHKLAAVSGSEQSTVVFEAAIHL